MSQSFIDGVGGYQPRNPVNPVPNNLNGPNVNGNQSQPHEPPPQAPVDNIAKTSLIGQLDVLLMNAARNAMTLVKTETVGQVLDALPLDEALKADILEIADKIDGDLKELGSYSGRELAEVMLNVNGRFELDTSYKLGNIGSRVKNLMDDFAEYSEKLQEIINDHHGAQGINILEEAMFQCDRRSCELTTLLMQFADLSLAEKDNPEVKKKLDLTLSELLPEQALKMHGNAAAIEKMREKVAPLAMRLDNLAKEPDSPVSMQELGLLKMEMKNMSEALELAMKEGFPSGDNGRVMVDNSLFGATKKILDDLRPRFDNVRRNVGQAAMRQVVRKSFKPLPKGTPISKNTEPIMKILAPSLYGAYTQYNKLKEVAERFAEEPTDKAAKELNEVNGQFQEFCRDKIGNIQKDLHYIAEELALVFNLNEAIAQKIAESAEPEKDMITEDQIHEMELALENLQSMHTNATSRRSTGKSPALELLNLFSEASSIGTQVCHLMGMKHALENLATEKIVTSDCVRMAFNGEMSTPSLVEARIHGMSDEDVDPTKDDSRLLSSRNLGKGNANTVLEVKYKDGSTFVFKPETPGRMGVSQLSIGRSGYADHLQIAQINMCVQKTAEELGLDDVMVKTTVGSHKGDYGFFMEKAPGVSGFKFIASPDTAPEDGLSLNDVKHLSEADYDKVKGRLMHKLNRLAWFDVITGQGDRHSNNYFVHISKDLQVTVKAIDNDMSFSINQIGLRTFKLQKKDIPYFYDKISKAQKSIYPTMNPPLKLLPDPGVTITKDSITVDVTKIKSPELFSCLTLAIGFQPSALPEAIDQELYDHLVELQSGEKREAYIEKLQSRLTQEAVDATVQRLDEAIKHAISLKAKGKVLKAEDFEKPDIQQQISTNGRGFKLPKRNGNVPLDNQQAKQAESLYKHYHCDIFHRDLAKYMDRTA